MSSLRGGPVLSGFSLDDGDFTVSPPAQGVPPVISRQEAECEALATRGLGVIGAVVNPMRAGIAVGYGMVSVASGLAVDTSDQYASDSSVPVPFYKDRLAWVIVYNDPQPVSSSPPPEVNCVSTGDPMTGSSPPTTVCSAPPTTSCPPVFTGYSYAVFVVDATTGADALTYEEARLTPCGFKINPPTVAVPIEQISVPWTLVSRNADAYSGVIAAEIPPCYSYDNYNGASVDEGSNTVQVLAWGPVGANCGPPRQVTMQLRADTVTSDLPATLTHAPVGLYVEGAAPSEPPVSSPAAGSLINLYPTDNGKPITVHVGDVVIAPPSPHLPGDNQGIMYAVTSSDPAVLGPLSPPDSPIAEFRAWKPGQATLTAPARTWTEQVIVLSR